MSSLKYRPEVDGLRTIAVIPVVLFHLGNNWIAGGYFGVDVFFVISGYLITSILLKEEKFTIFSFKNFFTRRVRRIMPALLFMVAVVLAVSCLISFRLFLQSFSSDALSAIFSYANISMLLKFGNYWGNSAETSPFLHCWSLSVEEQFYLIYPFFIAYFANNKKRLFIILSIISLLSFAAFMFAAKFFPTSGFFLLPTRAWELACGGLLAISGANLPLLKFKKHFSLLGIILIMLSFFVFTGSEGIGISALLPVIGSVLIIGYSSPNDNVGRFLKTKPMVEIGKMSYSLYLWHWPVIVLAKTLPARLYIQKDFYLLLQVIIIVFLVCFSYYIIEKKTRAMKPIFSFVGVVLLICLSEILLMNSSVLKSYYTSSFATTNFYGFYYDVSPIVKDEFSEKTHLKRIGANVPKRDAKFKDASFNDGIIKGTEEGFPTIVTFGDSHGAAMAKIIDEIGEELNVKRTFFTMPGNNPFFYIPFKETLVKHRSFTDEQFKLYAENFIAKLNLWKPKLLIIDCRWDSKEKDFDKIESLIKLSKNNKTSVLLINQPPIIEMYGEAYSVSQYLNYLGYKPNGAEQFVPLYNNEGVDEKNEKLRKLSDKYENSYFVDINSSFRKADSALIIKDNVIIHYDDDHLSYEGTLIIKDKLTKEIKNILNHSK